MVGVTMDSTEITRFVFAAQADGQKVQGILVRDFDGTHVLPYFSSVERAQEFGNPDLGGVPQGPGVTWSIVELSSSKLLYLLNHRSVTIDSVLEDPLPVDIDYSTAPLQIFLDRLGVEADNKPETIEGYGFVVS